MIADHSAVASRTCKWNYDNLNFFKGGTVALNMTQANQGHFFF